MEDKVYHLLSLYNKTPQWIKHALGYSYRLIPLSIRYGRIYTRYSKMLTESQWWTKEKHAEYQWRSLEYLLKHAYNNVPYYRKVFDEYGIKIKDIQNFKDFQKIPFLTKDIVRSNLKELVAKNYPSSQRMYVTSGGSTGPPLGLYYQKGVARAKEFAFMTTLWGRAGYKVGNRVAVLRGNVVRKPERTNFSQYDPIKNRLILSSFHMTDQHLPSYVEQIKRFQPEFLHVYPSTLTILANFMQRKKIQPFSSLKSILLGSENLYSWQLKVFQKVFRCNIFSWYGLNEMSALAGPCEHSNYYHVFPEYSYLELIGKKDTIVDDNGAIGEIVGTTFDNYVMPLIRYRTMDYAVPVNKNCMCGRNYKLLNKIVGRKQEFFVDLTGSLITFTCSDEPLWSVKDKINAYQYVQDEPGKVLLNIEARTKFELSEISHVKRDFSRFFPHFQIQIQFLDHIPRTKRGKFLYLIQKMPIDVDEFSLG